MRKPTQKSEKNPTLSDSIFTWEDFWFRAPPELVEFINQEKQKGYRTTPEYFRAVFYDLCRNGITTSSTYREKNGRNTPTT